MRTKEPKPFRQDFAMASRLSIQRDFRNAHFRRQGREAKQPETMQPKEPGVIHRVLALNERSSYAKYKRFVVGKLVRILRPASSGGYYVEFVRDEDREMLNANAGWNDKKEFLLDGAKFD